jgi:hypothetical protein
LSVKNPTEPARIRFEIWPSKFNLKNDTSWEIKAMGYLFETNESCLWSPSNDVAEAFLSHLTILERLVKVQSGFRQTMAGVIEVNPVQLDDILSATSAYLDNSNNVSLKALVRPVVTHLLAIHSRCGVMHRKKPFSSFEREWIADSVSLAEKGMPR